MNTKHSIACKGKTGTWIRTKKHNKAMSEATKGKIFAKDHKIKLSLALKKRWSDGTITPVITHGYSNTKTYFSWQDMKKRCFTIKNSHYKDYGGRGIKVCNRWLKFENFLADMGEKPEGMSLDRINVNKNYSPKNCRWASDIQQANNKRNNLKYKGETAAEASRRLGSKNSCLVAGRIFNGWSKEKAFTIPAKKINYPIKIKT